MKKKKEENLLHSICYSFKLLLNFFSILLIVGATLNYNNLFIEKIIKIK